MARTFLAVIAAFALPSYPSLAFPAGADPDGACVALEESLGRCFETGQSFVVEIVPGPSGEFPVVDANGNSEFSYLVTGPGAAGGSCAGVHDVSHVSIQIPVCAGAPLVIVSANPSGRLLTGGQGDPSCGFGTGDLDHDVFKWDVPVDCSGSGLFTLVFQGIVPAAPADFMLKEGPHCTPGTILGPDCPQTCAGSIGDFVWLDLDGDGLQENGDQGIAGVRLVLTNGAGTQVGETQTGPNGEYLFAGLCLGDYTVTVDPTTLPEGVEPSPCQMGPDRGIDNDCSPASTTLHGSVLDVRDVDFGYEPIPFVYCESNENSTGGEVEIDWSGSPSISENNFSLHFTGIPANQPGYLFYGTQQNELPFGDGVRCIGGTVTRFRKIANTTGGADVQIDFTLPPTNQIVPGVPYYFQFWYRDPQGGGAGYNTSDAICVIFAP